jgi:hypothetical protein
MALLDLIDVEERLGEWQGRSIQNGPRGLVQGYISALWTISPESKRSQYPQRNIGDQRSSVHRLVRGNQNIAATQSQPHHAG